MKKGVFGKCIVERKASGFNENVFEFNLTKCGNEGEFQYDNTDGWSLMATRELASKYTVFYVVLFEDLSFLNSCLML